MDDKIITITDETGASHDFEILFTYEHNGKKYVTYYDPESSDGQVYASIYDDEGNLFPIESDEEWAMLDEVLEAFQEDDGEEVEENA